jgi:hypothetical protein
MKSIEYELISLTRILLNSPILYEGCSHDIMSAAVVRRYSPKRACTPPTEYLVLLRSAARFRDHVILKHVVASSDRNGRLGVFGELHSHRCQRMNML